MRSQTSTTIVRALSASVRDSNANRCPVSPTGPAPNACARAAVEPICHLPKPSGHRSSSRIHPPKRIRDLVRSQRRQPRRGLVEGERDTPRIPIDIRRRKPPSRTMLIESRLELLISSQCCSSPIWMRRAARWVSKHERLIMLRSIHMSVNAARTSACATITARSRPRSAGCTPPGPPKARHRRIRSRCCP